MSRTVANGHPPARSWSEPALFEVGEDRGVTCATCGAAMSRLRGSVFCSEFCEVTAP